MDVSGFWQGSFTYPDKANMPVQFDCEIVQTNTLISGFITEVDVVHGPVDYVLAAKIAGEISGHHITFVKTYQDKLPGYSSVNYTGEVDKDAQIITGVWTISQWSGRFVMLRDKGVLLNESTRIVANDILIKA